MKKATATSEICKSPGLGTGQRHSWPGIYFLSAWLFLALIQGLPAQILSNLVFTVGTTIQDSGGNNWSYVLIGSAEPNVVRGKHFAIYGKPGFPTNTSPFTLRGTIFQQSDLTAINNLLTESTSLNEDLAALGETLDVFLHKVPGIGSQSLAQKVATAFQVSAGDPATADTFWLVSQVHPGLKLCAGLAFAEKITATTTYEIREVNPATGGSGDVLGRVTVTAGAPVVLSAPGYPFQVTTNAPSDHLRIRLRWGTPDALRRLSLLQYGFNVWRIPTAAAIASGYNLTPPTPVQLNNDGNFLRVNPAPVMATQDYAPFSGPGGPDDPTDRTTYFFSDNNGRLSGGQPFIDGTNFYYFITARDILGRDGLASPGGLATACRRIPPQAPTNLKVLNTVQVLPLGTGTTNQERLLVNWQQNTNSSDAVTEYWVYRWLNPAMVLTNDFAPLSNRIAVVSQLAGTNLSSMLDDNANSPASPGPSNYWFTVRAVSQAACGPLLSPHSPPASGVLRQREAPPATSGELVGSCGTPVVTFQDFNSLVNPNGADTNNWNYRVTVTRRDSGIAWAQIVIGDPYSSTAQSVGPLYFPPDGNSISVDYSSPAPGSGTTANFQASCSVGTYYGVVSTAVSCSSTNPVPANQISEAVFNSGELLYTALSSKDPFVQALNFNQSVCQTPFNVTRDASGTLHMRFDVAAGQPMMIQYGTNLNAVTFWTDIGVATPDTNRVYSIYLCPCVIGPLPQLRGCTMNLANDGNCDQHVARAGSSGAIAPILVKFRLTPRTHEYRLYRSVNGGVPTLIAQAAALFDASSPGNEIVQTDDAMPPSAARLCYFVQTLDENGNGSPLALIGCKDVVPPKPPRPVLSEPAPAGDVNNPQVALNWFCPTSGVYRFEIRITRDDQPASGKPTGLLSPKLIPLNTFKPLPFVGLKTKPVFYGLLADRKAVSVFDEWQLTPPISPTFGPGPQFSITANVVPNVPYEISVAAEDNAGNWGDASTSWKFVWQPPPTLQTVPWPARPLPPVTSFDDPTSALQNIPYAPRVAAVMFITNATHGVSSTPDAHYPVAVKFATILSKVSQIVLNIGNTNFASYSLSGLYTATSPGVDPNAGVFKRYSTVGASLLNGQSLLPFVIYRKQETNAAFPRVTGNLTQVTPLLEKVPWIAGGFPFRSVLVTIPDPLIAMWQEDWNDQDYTFLGLRDQQPVILGARYHYYAVRLNDQHEVAEIIDAGTVDIPSQ
jgi:hypothetical protein